MNGRADKDEESKESKEGKDKKAKLKEKSRVRAFSLSKVFKKEKDADVEENTSARSEAGSQDDSPTTTQRDSGSDLDSPKTPTKLSSSSSHFRSLFSPRNSSPRPGTKGSPRITIAHNEHPEGIFPISKDTVEMLKSTARKKFEKCANKSAGLSFKYITGTHVNKDYTVVVLGNASSEISHIFLVSRTKLGDGANGDVYLAYDLQQETKIATKMFIQGTQFKSVRKAKERLIARGHFQAMFSGEVFDVSGYVIFMTFVPGVSLIDLLYKTDSALKANLKTYKDEPEFYLDKIANPYEECLALGEAAVLGLDEVHQSALVQNDLSPDNFLVYKSTSGYKACLIDSDGLTDMRCMLMHTTIRPQKDNVSQLIDFNAAYIRFDEQLFYVNKDANEFVELKIADATAFDKVMGKASGIHVLTKEELQRITALTGGALTGHAHHPPRIPLLEVAYAYAAPELQKREYRGPRPLAAYATDIYMLGVVLLDIFTPGLNLMKLLKEDFKAMMIREDYHRVELTTAELKKLASDFFEDKVPSADKKLSIADAVYYKFILPDLRYIVESLLVADPVIRSQVNLTVLATELNVLHSHFLDTTAALQLLVDGISVIQGKKIALTSILAVIRDYSPHAVNKLLDKAIKPTPMVATKGDFSVMIELLEEEKRVEELRFQEKKQVYDALIHIMEGLSKLKKQLGALDSLDSLIAPFCPNRKEAIDFVKQLTETSTKEIKLVPKT